MAGSPPPVDTPKLGIKATVAGLIFALAVLAGFGVATAASYEDQVGDKHGDEHHDEDHGDDHSDDDHGEDGDHDDDHGDDHGDDDDHSDG